MKPHTLYCSDTHLRHKRGDEQFAFTQIVDAAIGTRGVKRVIVAGDMLDKQSNRSRVISFVMKEVDRLEAAGIEFWYTQGQHDWDDPPWLSGHRWARHMHRQTVEADGCCFYGLDWQPFGALQEELKEVPEGADALVCHQVWSDWMGQVTNPQGAFAEVPGHIKLLLTGDLHERRLERRKNADGVKMTVVSAGATTQQKIDEPADHFYCLVFPDGSVEHKRLKSRVMIDWSVMNRSEDVDRFAAEIEPELASAAQKAAAMDLPADMCRPYLRVTYSPRLSDTVRRVERLVGDRAVLYFKELLPEEKVEAYQKARKGDKGAAVTPLSVLDQEVDKDESPQVYELVSRMLQATDKELELSRWRAEFMGDAQKED